MAAFAPATTFLFVQPHYDDVPLSCGGTVALAGRQGGDTRVITVFASELADAMVNDFARWKHERWAMHDSAVVTATRRAEDKAAAEALNARLHWLGFPDAIYRNRYHSDEAMYGQLDPVDGLLSRFIAREIADFVPAAETTVVFVPLGIGGHPDHQICFEAGRMLAGQGVRVLAYEDCPYAIHTPTGLQARLDSIGDEVEQSLAIAIEDGLADRLHSIAAYSSQLPVIFRFTEDYRGAVTDHCLASGNGRPAERFWPVIGKDAA